MKETLETINRMQAENVITRYAIGDAVGATFYLDRNKLDNILARHNLVIKWQQFVKRYLQ